VMSVTELNPSGSRHVEVPPRSEEPEVKIQRALEASQIMIRAGDLEEARRLLRAAVHADPSCSEAWLRLAWLSQSRQERKALLLQVLALEPGHEKARAELARVDRPSTGQSTARAGSVKVPAGQPAKGRTGWRARYWLWGLLALAITSALAALLLWGPVGESLAWLRPTSLPTVTPRPTDTPAEIAARFVPKLEASLSAGDWETALEIVAIMRGVDPSGQGVKNWALTAHVQYGKALVEDGRADEALAQFDEAAAENPDDPEARLWQETTQIHLRGREALEAGDLEAALHALSLAYERIPSYRDAFTLLVEAFRRQAQESIEAERWTQAIDLLTRADEKVLAAPAIVELLVQAYRQRGILRQEQGELEAARTDLEAVLALWPADAEAQTHLDEVMYKLFPPKRIEIDISKQRLYVWEGDEQVYEFVVSTGLPGQDTAAGHFKVLDKIPMAYSSVWRLKMPHWLGIYYIHDIENGIHALPIRPDGSVMWGGLLGQRASYGCIILNNEAAKTLYEWAEIGTAVDIHY
jgi:tetratricopeptide (TPR) repeat protein